MANPAAPKNTGEKIGEFIGKKIRGVLQKKAKELGTKAGKAVLEKVGLGKRAERSPSKAGTTSKGRRAVAKRAEKDDEQMSRAADRLSLAGADMGRAGLGVPHEISNSERLRRARSMREAQKLRWV